jgi:thiol-disulfide isomerase/thioredoxin
MARLWISFGGLTLALTLALPVLAQDKKPAVKAAVEKSANEKAAADPYAVPAGTTKELKDFIQKLVRDMPHDEPTRDKARAAIRKAAEQILAGKPSDEDLDFAVDAILRSLIKSTDVTVFGEELKKAGHEKQMRAVRRYALDIGMKEAILSGKGDLLKKQIAAVLNYFKEVPPQSDDMSLAIMTGQVAEIEGDNAYAVDVYRNLSKAFRESKDDRLAEYGKRLEGVSRRLSLLGNKMQLEGKLLSGEDFDYSKYQGKVVLINFWASWRHACAADLPILKKNYKLYHDKGFEIIGFGCDYKREDMELFVKNNQIPWTTVYGDNGPSPTFEYYGIMTFPTMILIGKDGNVKEMNVGSDELGKKLEELFGPAEKK